MSATYPDLTNTQFPDAIDTMNNFVDITLTTLPLAQQYYSLYNAGDIDGANQILTDNPDLKYSFIGAASLNPIVDSIKAIELFYTQDVQNYLVNIVQYKGDFSATTKYTKYNTVTYLNDSALEIFMCIRTDTPIGIIPTNLSYWVPLTMRGEQGEAGIGLSAYGSWNSLTTYPQDAMVAYNNALWGSLIENTNITPSGTATSTWYKIIEFSSDLLTFTDSTTSTQYALTINNGNVYFLSDNYQIDIALKTDIPTTLPANGGISETISTTLPIDKGGTGATTVALARNALGLGNTTGALPVANGGTGQTSLLATRNAMGLGNTTGALPIANGGTGATSASSALSNLGLTATASELNYMDGVTSNVQTQLDGKATSYHTHAASSITAGTLPTGVLTTNSTDYSTSRLRNISATTFDLTPGTSALASGAIVLVYE